MYVTSTLLLQIIDRLPMTVESLKTSKLGKIVVKVGKDVASPGELSFFLSLSM